MQYLPEIAIIVSLVSLFLSLRNNHFNATFRLIEAKTEMLSVLSETSINHSRSLALQRQIVQDLKRLPHADIVEMATGVETMIEGLDASLERIYVLARSLEEKDILKEYKTNLPEMRRLRDQSIQLHDGIKRIEDLCANPRAKA